MNKVIFASIFLFVAQSAFAGQLKSKALRKIACAEMIDSIEYGSDYALSITKGYEYGNKDLIFLDPEFKRECEQSKDSFQVPSGGTTYSKRLKKVVGIDVEVNFQSTAGFTVTGNIRFERKVTYNRKTDDVDLKNWSLSQQNLSFDVSSNIIKRISRIIVSNANIHNGHAYVEEYDVTNFSLEQKKILRKYEWEQESEEDSCGWQVNGNEDIDYFEGYGSYDGTALDLINFLADRGYIREIVDVQSEDFSESCAYAHFYIYLTNGTLIVLNYDFTT